MVATIKQVGEINTKDEVLNRIQAEFANKVNPVLVNPLLNGKLIEVVALKAASPVVVPHGLGRVPRGWIVVDRNASATMWRSAPFTKQTITLSVSADVTVTLWIF